MPIWADILIAIAVVVIVLGLIAWLYLGRRREQGLRSRFSGEYDRTVARTGSRSKAERTLRAREKRHAQLEIVPLPAATRERFTHRWETVQSAFVDGPEEAVRGADRLVQEVMEKRGYPVENFDQQAADISVDHADLVENYRAAHAICGRATAGKSTTEELRQAMRHYRALFEELLGDDVGPERRTADLGEADFEEEQEAVG